MSTLSTSKGESPAGPVLVVLLSVRRARSIPGHEQIRTARHRRFLWLAHRPARTDQGAARHAGESRHPRTARPPPPGALAPQGRVDGSRKPASQVRKNLLQRREGPKEDRKRKPSHVFSVPNSVWDRKSREALLRLRQDEAEPLRMAIPHEIRSSVRLELRCGQRPSSPPWTDQGATYLGAKAVQARQSVRDFQR